MVLDALPVDPICLRMRMYKALGSGLLAATGVLLSPTLGAQEKQLTTADRSHTDVKFSPDGKTIAYQSAGTLYTQLASGGGERQIVKLGSAFTYFWDRGGLTWIVFQGSQVRRFDSTGNSQVISNLAGKNVISLFYLTKNNQYLYGIRMDGLIERVFRIDFKNIGKLTDLVALPSVGSVDVNQSESKILYSTQT